MTGNYNFNFYQPLIYLTNLFIIIILIGPENNSWGYRSDNGNFFNPSVSSRDDLSYGPPFTTGDTIGCCFNSMNDIVFYTKNGVHLGSYYFNTNS